MDTQKTLIMQDGREAFYDQVLRYKNPYDGVGSSEFWFQGWDAACEEHKLFTANQDLCLKNQELLTQVEELISQAAQSSKDHYKLTNLMARDCQELIALKKVSQELKQSKFGRDEDIRSIIASIESGNFITFSREKIRIALKELVSRG